MRCRAARKNPKSLFFVLVLLCVFNKTAQSTRMLFPITRNIVHCPSAATADAHSPNEKTYHAPLGSKTFCIYIGFFSFFKRIERNLLGFNGILNMGWLDNFDNLRFWVFDVTPDPDPLPAKFIKEPDESVNMSIVYKRNKKENVKSVQIKYLKKQLKINVNTNHIFWIICSSLNLFSYFWSCCVHWLLKWVSKVEFIFSWWKKNMNTQFNVISSVNWYTKGWTNITPIMAVRGRYYTVVIICL